MGLFDYLLFASEQPLDVLSYKMSLETQALEHFRAAKYVDAAKLFAKVVESHSDMISSTKKALLLCNRAVCFYELGMYKHSIRECDAALTSDVSCQQAYICKGQALQKLKRESEAKAVWQAGSLICADIRLHVQLYSLAQGNTLASQATAFKQTSTSKKQPPSNKAAAEKAATEVAKRRMVQHGVGIARVDEQIAIGYLQVNTGKYEEGIKLFTALIQDDPKLFAAYLGRGTAFALLGQLEAAVQDFSRAIDIDPVNSDPWKRRAQSNGAMGRDQEALYDLCKAASLQKDHEVFHQRGLIYYKLKNYRKALTDFQESLKYEDNYLSFNHLGLCYNALGQPKEAMSCFDKALDKAPSFKESWANLGQSYKDVGDFEKAYKMFTKALTIDPNYLHAYYTRGLALFGSGRHARALFDFERVVSLDAKNKDGLHMQGICFHGLGVISKAIASYSKCVDLQPDHVAWYNRELAVWLKKRLDVPWATFNMDREIDAYFKESWCKRLHPALLVSYEPQVSSSEIPDVDTSRSLSETEKIVAATALQLGSRMQLHCPGYLKNQRQYLSFGLATLQIAQVVAQFWKKGECRISDSARSKPVSSNKLGWRDVYDIAVRWRQLSEPNDPVWWVDLLSPEQFAEGFGSHTPLVTGQCNVVRYFPMFSKALPIVKKLLLEANFTTSQQEKIKAASSCKDLYDALNRDFWVVTPCNSVARPGCIMEGTRLTLQYSTPEGFEFSIRTPGTPPRLEEYEHEMTSVWTLLCAEASKSDYNLDRVSDLILTMTFYWYNFMPLSRGSAATGFNVLLACFLSLDIEIATDIPSGVQPDWEGILNSSPDTFISMIKPWMYPYRKQTSLLNDLGVQ